MSKIVTALSVHVIKHRSAYMAQFIKRNKLMEFTEEQMCNYKFSKKKSIIFGEDEVVRYHNEGDKRRAIRFAEAVRNGDVLLVPGGRDLVNRIYVGPPDHPPQGATRLFTDISFSPITKEASYAIIVLQYEPACSRDFKFNMFWGKLYDVQTPTEAELDGVKEGIRIALEEGYNHPIIANDCSRVISWMHGMEVDAMNKQYGRLKQKIRIMKAMANKIEEVEFEDIPRVWNGAADKAAKYKSQGMSYDQAKSELVYTIEYYLASIECPTITAYFNKESVLYKWIQVWS